MTLRISSLIPFFFLTSILYAQQKPRDLQAYQEFRFGESRAKVESRLRKDKAVITEANQAEIIVRTELDLDNVFLPISLKKQFEFYRGKLWSVTLRYQQPLSLTRTDSVAFAFLRQLYRKYGHAQQDTTMPDEMMTARLVRWDFPSGYIVFNWIKFGESVKALIPGLVGDIVSVSYNQAGISEIIEAEQRKKMSREF